MVTKEKIAEKLNEFEQLAGVSYAEDEKKADKLIDIWHKHLQNFDEKIFDKNCNRIEKSIKWHILPTLYDFYEAIRKRVVRYG